MRSVISFSIAVRIWTACFVLWLAGFFPAQCSAQEAQGMAKETAYPSLRFTANTSWSFQQVLSQALNDLPAPVVEDLRTFRLEVIGCQEIPRAVNEIFGRHPEGISWDYVTGYYRDTSVLVAEWYWIGKENRWVQSSSVKGDLNHEVLHALNRLWGERLAEELERQAASLSEKDKALAVRLKRYGLCVWPPIWNTYVTEAQSFVKKPVQTERDKALRDLFIGDKIGRLIRPVDNGFAAIGCNETITELGRAGLLGEANLVHATFPLTYEEVIRFFNQRYKAKVMALSAELRKPSTGGAVIAGDTTRYYYRNSRAADTRTNWPGTTVIRPNEDPFLRGTGRVTFGGYGGRYRHGGNGLP